MRVYISGPMSGREELNKAGFQNAAEYLRNQGHEVYSPWEHWDAHPNETDEGYKKSDIYNIIDAQAVYMLEGWETSPGAITEHRLAVWLGRKIYYQGRIL